ncbi:MAG: hypothetical protein GMKNLPBB_01750 [Myxococcota bacterium]|nr:hypothetical protein [Myxococcota bacterium]
MKYRRQLLFLLLAALAAGCAEQTQQNSGVDGGGFAADAGIHSPAPSTSGERTWTIDAQNADKWVPVDLDKGEAGTPVAETAGCEWDIALQRFKVKSNGGANGKCGAAAAILKDVSWESVTKAPSSGFMTDAPVEAGADTSRTFESVFNSGDAWFSYNSSNHVLTARENLIYVVRTTAKRFFKIQFLKYYDGAGTPGFVQFRSQEIPGDAAAAETSAAIPPGAAAPAPDASVSADASADGGSEADGAGPADSSSSADATPADSVVNDTGPADASDAAVADSRPPQPLPTRQAEIAAADGQKWIYFQLGGTIVNTATPETSTEWDIGFSRTLIRTNSGISGPGKAGAALLKTASIQDEADMSALAFEVDKKLPAQGPPGTPDYPGNPVLAGWFNYDPATHRVSPKDHVYALRLADGTFAKFRITGWKSGVFQIDFIAAGPGVTRF